MCFAALRFLWNGWVHEFYIQPVYHFTFYGFDWIQPWSGWGMYAHFVGLAVLALFIAFGLWYRWSVFLFFLGFTYVELLDKSYYLNHYYLISLISLLLWFMPLHRAGSLDAWRKPLLRSTAFPDWVLWTLRLQIGLVYFFAGVAKIKTDWVFHAQPLKLWLAARSDFPVFGFLLDHVWVAYAFSWTGLVFDLTVPFWLLWRRTRLFAYIAIVVFHAITGKLFFLGMFPYIMVGLTTLFFSPSWPRTWLPTKWLPPQPGQDRSDTTNTSPQTPRWKTPAVFALTMFFAVQMALPFRHHLYGGNVCWHEQGFRFSWKVMLVEKTGYIEFNLRDPKTKKTWSVAPTQFLTKLQATMMRTQPDMILQFAHWLSRFYQRKGHPPPEVRVESYVSLNGRRRKLFIDPKVDLAKQPRGFSNKTWILPPSKETPP